MDEEGTLGSNKFSVGDRVRVLPGVKDPDFKTDIGGWSGVVVGVESEDLEEILYLIHWDEMTLAAQGERYITKCEKKDLNYELIYLVKADLELLTYPEGYKGGVLLA